MEESTWFRTPALKVRGKSFCRMKEDGETLVIQVVDLEDKEALLRSDPEVFFTTPHYDGYAYVLVRLDRIGRDAAGRAGRGRVAPPRAQVASVACGACSTTTTQISPSSTARPSRSSATARRVTPIR